VDPREKPFDSLIFEEIEPRVGLVTLNRPDRLNAIHLKMLEEFEEVCQFLSKDESIRILIITGKGRGFCSGADLMEVMTHRDHQVFADPEMFLRMVQEKYTNLILSLRNIPQPVIAAVNGPAAGGGLALALAADIRVASPEACFIPSFINIGLSAGEMGTSYLLPRLIGLSRASEILFTGRKVYGEEAEKIGLVSKLAPRETLMEAALSYARMMLEKNTGGLKLTKRVLEQNSTAASLEAAINLENRNQVILIFSGEFYSRIQAFFGEK
jgi:enoyl-CoA hydratase/carnithine racemase